MRKPGASLRRCPRPTAMPPRPHLTLAARRSPSRTTRSSEALRRRRRCHSAKVCSLSVDITLSDYLILCHISCYITVRYFLFISFYYIILYIYLYIISYYIISYHILFISYSSLGSKDWRGPRASPRGAFQLFIAKEVGKPEKALVTAEEQIRVLKLVVTNSKKEIAYYNQVWR